MAINGYKITALSTPPFITDTETFLPIISKNSLNLYQNYKLSISDIKNIIGLTSLGLTFRGLISSQTNVLSNSIYLINSSSNSFNIYLPKGNNGEIIKFADHAGNNLSSPTGLGEHSVTIFPYTEETIQSESQLVLNKDNQSIELIFYIDRWTIIGT